MSQKVGESIAGNSDMRGSKSKQADSAADSLGQFAKGRLRSAYTKAA